MSPFSVQGLLLLLAALPQEARTGLPVVAPGEGYVGSEACRSCHLGRHESWSDSYHRTMAQFARESTVLAPFAGESFDLEGRRWTFTTEEGRHLATSRRLGDDGVPFGGTDRREVVLLTGSHHYQIYWLEGRCAGMGQLPVVWDPHQRSWVPRTTLFVIPPGQSTEDETGRWTGSCIQCHALNGTPHGVDGERALVAELGISCEACHGPGERHVAFHEDESNALEPGAPDPTIVQPARLPHDRASEVCGQCHALRPLPWYEREEWKKEGFAYRPGDVLSETRHLLRGTFERNAPAMRAYLQRNPGTLDTRFWADGEVRVSGREFNGLFESPCYQRGELSCLSCHSMHQDDDDPRSRKEWADDQLRTDMRGPGACLQCHDAYADRDAWREHAHHEPGTPGGDCLNCHMPRTTYGLTKLIHSHTITAPNAEAASRTNRPLACNLCHLDRSLGWAADHMSEWYGHERPTLARDVETTAASVLWALRGDAGARAVAAWCLGWEPAREVSGTGWMPFLFSTLLMDPYDAVRWIALRSQRLDPRYAELDLDFTAHIEAQRNVIRETVLSDWLREGLEAREDQREAVLVLPDGKLDEPRFRHIYAQRDRRPVSLSE